MSNCYEVRRRRRSPPRSLSLPFRALSRSRRRSLPSAGCCARGTGPIEADAGAIHGGERERLAPGVEEQLPRRLAGDRAQRCRWRKTHRRRQDGKRAGAGVPALGVAPGEREAREVFYCDMVWVVDALRRVRDRPAFFAALQSRASPALPVAIGIRQRVGARLVGMFGAGVFRFRGSERRSTAGTAVAPAAGGRTGSATSSAWPKRSSCGRVSQARHLRCS